MQVNPTRIAQGIVNQERRFLSRAITLTESVRPDHATVIGDVLRNARHLVQQKHREQVASGVDHYHGPRPRIAITGAPGAGKSTLIEAMGTHLVEKRGLSLGVLAVDPSDADRGGSVLGDKTRMDVLSNHPRAFVRPSPSRGTLGGVTARCWEALEVFEAAEFDMTIVETVGVGQSEIEARHLSDLFVLLVPPLGGDDLQGVKRGIMHAADLIVVTKADENNEAQLALAEQAASFYRRSASLLHVAPTNHHSTMGEATGGGANGKTDHGPCLKKAAPTEVMMVSSKTGSNIDVLADKIFEMFQDRLKDGTVQSTRQNQRLRHFRSYFEQAIVEQATAQLKEQGMWEAFENQVVAHAATPREAGDAALGKILRKIQ